MTAQVEPTTIDEVLAALDVIIADARATSSRLGFFAVLYRDVTARVRKAIVQGRFENGARMERLDVAFANRYLNAYNAYKNNEEISHCWRVAFDAADRRRPIILQHLLLGMNAHINLDLGLAAATSCPPHELPSLKRDFEEVTVLLAEMIDEVQARLDRVSPWMGWLDRIGHRTDEQLCGFCISASRKLAWGAAEQISAATPEERGPRETELDLVVAGLALPITRPPLLTSAILACVGLREESNVGRVIDTLALGN